MKLAGPLVLQLVSFSMMSVVDTLFVGRLGEAALAAVGLGSMFVLTVASFGQSVLSACRLLVGQAVGRRDQTELDRLLGVFLRLGLGLGLVSFLVALASAALLPWMAADAETGAQGARYAAIRGLGIPAILASAALGQWLTGQSWASAPMRAAIVANVVNIPLNAIFLFVFGLGTDGSALATAIAHGVELLVLLMAAKEALGASGGRRTGLWKGAWKASNGEALALLRLGTPTGAERVLDMMAFAAVPLLLSYAGSAHVAAHQITLQVSLFAFLPLIALSDAASVLTAQAFGARSFSLIRRINQAGVWLAVTFAVLFSVTCVLLRAPIARAFTHEPTVLEATLPALIGTASIQVANAAYNILKGTLRGLGDFHFVAWCAVLCAWIVTPPLTYLWSVRGTMGASGAWAAIFVEVTIGLVIIAVRTRRKLAELRDDESIPLSLAETEAL